MMIRIVYDAVASVNKLSLYYCLTPMGTPKMDPFSWSPISLSWLMKRIVWPRVVKFRLFISNLDIKEFHIAELRGRYHQKKFSQPSPQGTVYPWELSQSDLVRLSLYVRFI